MTTRDLMSSLSRRYEPKVNRRREWSTFEEVTLDESGHRMDLLAVNLWPSRGHAFHGHELKVSRADWLSELEKPAKAEASAKLCDYWWLVVADQTIIQPGELPMGWGLMAPGRRGTIRTFVEAQKNDAQLSRRFIISLISRANREGDEALSVRWKLGYEAGVAEMEQRASKSAQSEVNANRHIMEFRSETGLNMSKWGGEYEAEVKIVVGMLRLLRSAPGQVRDQLQSMLRLTSEIGAVSGRMATELTQLHALVEAIPDLPDEHRQRIVIDPSGDKLGDKVEAEE